MNPDQEFIEYVIKKLVTLPDQVITNRTVDELGVLISVRVAQPDMGLIIGRAGSTANAIRTIARALGMKTKSRINIKLEEPDGIKVT
jgi:predicted RNA-binding protein YlqC (UPF0109 family)